jgi:hypothetical protein
MSADRDRLCARVACNTCQLFFFDLPQIGDRLSINILVIESASLSLASNRPDSQPHDATDLTRTVCTEQAGRPEESSDLTHSFHKGSVYLMSLHPSRRLAVAAQPDAGIERGLKTHRVSGLLP